MSNEIIVLLVAIYGAGLSTFLAIREYRKDRPRIKVKCAYAFTSTLDFQDILLLSIEVINDGHRPVTIKTVEIGLNNNESYVQLRTRIGENVLPYKLSDGESKTYYFELETLEKKLRERNLKYTKAIVKDAGGRVYKGKLPPPRQNQISNRS